MFEFDSNMVKKLAEKHPAFALSARFWTGSALFNLGGDRYLLEMRDGKLEDFRRADRKTRADITISGPENSWTKLFQRPSPPGFADPLYDDGRGGFTVEGDMVNAVAPYYPIVQEFLEVLRHAHAGEGTQRRVAEVDREFDAAVGRYMYVRIQGVQYRIYYEESGEGEIPMLLQHTAGADGRQWRHVLEDPDYRKHYRIISYDLPFHGKSIPPTSHNWWEEPYVLTRSFLMEAVIAISRKLKLERPVFMGCSVGGMLAPDLAYYHPDEFRAVIAINGGLAMELASPKPGIEKTFSNPRVGPQWKAAMMRANTAPTSPEAYRRETMWVYSQGAPPVLEGDVYYYMTGHDLTAEQAAQIDTSKVAVYLLTGEYDFLAIETGTKRLAAAIKNCHFEISPGLGHFGPAENPDGFKAVLMPVLREIAGVKSGAGAQSQKLEVRV
jgi:pimeloyl-ACP methyl ester carboxylesterase